MRFRFQPGGGVMDTIPNVRDAPRPGDDQLTGAIATEAGLNRA